MRTALFATALSIAAVPASAIAQEQSGPGSAPVAGFLAGAVGGAFVGVSVLTARSHYGGRYFYSLRAAIPPLSAFTSFGAIGGTALGWEDSELLGLTVRRAAALGLAGFVLGGVAGAVFEPTTPFALALVGAGIGVLAGSIWALADGTGTDAPPAAPQADLLLLRIRL